MNFADMPASHFLFIPGVLLIGIVIGWILGSRAAKDAYAVELKKHEARRASGTGHPGRTPSTNDQLRG
jgi:hypothetical protein